MASATILVAPFDSVRHALGFEAADLTDAKIADAAVIGNHFVERVVPNWQLILDLVAPAAPAPVAVANPSSGLVAGQYYVRLAYRAGGVLSPVSDETAIAILAGQAIHVPTPVLLGAEAWEVFVGVMAGSAFSQGVVATSAGADITNFVYGKPVAVESDKDMLKAAATYATCASLCSAFHRSFPKELQTLTYKESFDIDWRKAAVDFERRTYGALGLISTYKIAPALAMRVAGSRPVLVDDDAGMFIAD